MIIGLSRWMANTAFLVEIMTTERKSPIYITVLICIISLCFILCVDICNPAYAINNNSPTVVSAISELFRGSAAGESAKNFDAVNLSNLYFHLTGKTNATLADVNSKGTMTARAIKTNNGNKDIVVTLGGLNWTVTYVTKDKDGNTVATLWLADTPAAEKYQWQKWNAHAPTAKYPSSMYSTSYVRASMLNSGGCGYVAANGDTTLTKIAQSESHKYARFTMPDAKDSLTDFIVKPARIGYQETENARSYGGYVRTQPNEAYGNPSGSVIWVDNFNWSNRPEYAEWSNDYIWLPSLTEIRSTGIWQLSNNQRAGSTDAWTRTSNYEYSNGAAKQYASGSGELHVVVTEFNAVRPAMHLNLTAADKAAVYDLPQGFSVQYDGTVKSAQSKWTADKQLLSIMKLDTSSDITATDAGVYKAKLSLPTPYRWAVKEDGGGWHTASGAQEVQWEITKKDLTLDWSGIDAAYSWSDTLQSVIANYRPKLSGAIATDGVRLTMSYDTDVNMLDTEGAHTITASIVATDMTKLANNYALPSESSMQFSYTVSKSTQAAPSINIDYALEQFDDAVTAVGGISRLNWLQYYDADIGDWQSIPINSGGSKYDILEAFIGKSVRLRYKVPTEYASYILDSDETTVRFPARPLATAPVIDFMDEQVNIVKTCKYAFSLSGAPGDSDYTTAPPTEKLSLYIAGGVNYIANYGNQEYVLYYYEAATSTQFRSEVGELTIPARPQAPKVGINYISEQTLERLTDGMYYSLNNGAAVQGDYEYVKLNPTSDAGSLNVWYAASDKSFSSTRFKLTIPARRSAPDIRYDKENEKYEDGSMQPEIGMLYTADLASVWSEVEAESVFKRGGYYFKYVAVSRGDGSGDFASEYCYVDYGDKPINVEAEWSLGGVTSNGNDGKKLAAEYTGGVIKPSVRFFEIREDGSKVPLTIDESKKEIKIEAAVGSVEPINAGEYVVEVVITNPDGSKDTIYKLSNATLKYEITPVRLKVPQAASMEYNGEEQNIKDGLPAYLDGLVTVTGEDKAKDVRRGSGYTVQLRLTDSKNYKWDDAAVSGATVQIQWNITPLHIFARWLGLDIQYTGEAQGPSAVFDDAFDELTLIYTGDVTGIEIGSYTISVEIDVSDANYLNYVIENGTTVYSIVPEVGRVVVFIEWRSEAGAFEDGGELVYNGEVQYPRVSVRDRDGNELSGVEIIYNGGDAIISKYVGEYTLSVRVSGNYYIDSSCLTTIKYKIVADAEGNGEYKIIDIEITGSYKKNYNVGEKFENVGMIVNAIYTDGSKEEIYDYEYTQDALQEGDNTITVTYGEFSKSITVSAGIASVDGKWVSKKVYIITTAAIVVLILLCIALASGIIHMNKKMQRMFNAVIGSDNDAAQSEEENRKEHNDD